MPPKTIALNMVRNKSLKGERTGDGKTARQRETERKHIENTARLRTREKQK